MSATPPTGTSRRWRLGRRLLLLVVFGVVMPLGTIGLWTTRNAARSGKALLRMQLDSTLDAAVRGIDQRWQDRQSDLLLLGENEPVRLALNEQFDSGEGRSSPPPFVVETFATLSGVDGVTFRDRNGNIRWSLKAIGRTTLVSTTEDAGKVRVERSVPVHVRLLDLVSGDTIGVLDAQIEAASLLPNTLPQASSRGPLTAMFFGEHGMRLPPGAEESIFFPSGQDQSGHQWLAVRSRLEEPDVEVVVSAMLDPFIEPFQRSARLGAMALLAAALCIVTVVVFFMARVTREVDGVVSAAEAVSAGDLNRQLPVHSPDELARISIAFNTMTESLRRTLRDLAQKEALAAVGQFASELSHEIRNPLASVRLDLQRIEEIAGDEAAVRAITPRLLQQIERLDRAVTGALRVSRGTGTQRAAVEISQVLQAATRTARPEFLIRGAQLDVDEIPTDLGQLQGDSVALEQVFVNLLVNAAHSLGPGGETRLNVGQTGQMIVVSVIDNGAGMSPEQLAHIQEPFRSSKRDGTGLGLKIARRLVEAHRGRIEIESVVGIGTTVRVFLPGANVEL